MSSAAAAPQPRRNIGWRHLERRAERALAALEAAGVSAQVREQVRALLLAPVQRVRPYVPHRLPGRAGRERFCDLIETRLNRCEGWLRTISLEEWARLLREVLPERFAAPPASGRAAAPLDAPGLPSTVALMAARNAAGEAVRRADDPAELPDDRAARYPDVGRNGALKASLKGTKSRGGDAGGEQIVSVEVLQLQGEGRDPLPSGGKPRRREPHAYPCHVAGRGG